MRITSLQLKHFRCFSEFQLNFDAPHVVIAGHNGAGKTSLLEALHFACYLRSFRTHLPRHLIAFKQEACFVKVGLSSDEYDEQQEIQVGCSPSKKLVKVNSKPISTYKELTSVYRVITATEDDVMLVKGSPELRRSFLDQSLAMLNPAYIEMLRSYKKVLVNRNTLLQSGKRDIASYDVWTQQLREHAFPIQKERGLFVTALQNRMQTIMHTYFDSSYEVALDYRSKDIPENGGDLFERERAMKRSLVGIHLDDMHIAFRGTASRVFASRGQQKLLLLSLKIAFLQELTKRQGGAVVLLDDFITDFDEEKIEILLNVLYDLPYQVILTSPVEGGFGYQQLLEKGAQKVSLTH